MVTKNVKGVGRSKKGDKFLLIREKGKGKFLTIKLGKRRKKKK